MAQFNNNGHALIDQFLETLRQHGCDPQPESGKSNQWTCRCPAHDDHTPSLSIGLGDDGRALVKCQAGCATTAIVYAVGLSMAKLFPERLKRLSSGGGKRRGKKVAEFE